MAIVGLVFLPLGFFEDPPFPKSSAARTTAIRQDQPQYGFLQNLGCDGRESFARHFGHDNGVFMLENRRDSRSTKQKKQEIFRYLLCVYGFQSTAARGSGPTLGRLVVLALTTFFVVRTHGPTLTGTFSAAP